MQTPPRSDLVHPQRALSRVTLQPILYLADRMAAADGSVHIRETAMIDDLAATAGMAGFRREDWYRRMNEEEAIARVRTDPAKLCALVVLSLVLKTDGKRQPAEHEYFTRIRKALGAPPVTVPRDLDQHKALALEYMRDRGAHMTG